MTGELDDRLRAALAKLHDGERPLRFEEAWGGATNRARASSFKGAWRWALGPAVAAVAIVVVVVLSRAGGMEVARRGVAVASLDDLAIPDGGPGTFGARFAPSFGAGDEQEDGDTLALSGALGTALFVGETDFILDLEPPSWREDGERMIP